MNINNPVGCSSLHTGEYQNQIIRGVEEGLHSTMSPNIFLDSRSKITREEVEQ